jgi:threonine/homoserine efflux transporter RhtA
MPIDPTGVLLAAGAGLPYADYALIVGKFIGSSERDSNPFTTIC